MYKQNLRLCAFFGLSAVILGAFGAHGLKPHLSEYQITIFEKGVQYQFVHTLALGLVAALQAAGRGDRLLSLSVWFFSGGILLFSGSLYLLACRDLLPFPVSFAGPLTPIGGVGFIVGWAFLFGHAGSGK